MPQKEIIGRNSWDLEFPVSHVPYIEQILLILGMSWQVIGDTGHTLYLSSTEIHPDNYHEVVIPKDYVGLRLFRKGQEDLALFWTVYNRNKQYF